VAGKKFVSKEDLQNQLVATLGKNFAVLQIIDQLAKTVVHPQPPSNLEGKFLEELPPSFPANPMPAIVPDRTFDPLVNEEKKADSKSAPVPVADACENCSKRRKDFDLVWCKNCEAAYCKDCWQELHQNKVMSRHQVIDMPRGLMCIVHGTIADYYCFEDKAFICKKCTEKGQFYFNKKALPIPKAIDDLKSTFNAMLHKADLAVEGLGKIDSEFSKITESISCQYSEAEFNVLFDQITENLKLYQSKLVGLFLNVLKQHSLSLEEEKSKLIQVVEKTRHLSAQTNEILSTKNDTDVLDSGTDLAKEFQKHIGSTAKLIQSAQEQLVRAEAYPQVVRDNFSLFSKNMLAALVAEIAKIPNEASPSSGVDQNDPFLLASLPAPSPKIELVQNPVQIMSPIAIPTIKATQSASSRPNLPSVSKFEWKQKSLASVEFSWSCITEEKEELPPEFILQKFSTPESSNGSDKSGIQDQGLWEVIIVTTSNSFLLENLLPRTQNLFRVCYRTAKGFSEWSEVKCVVLLPPMDQQPSSQRESVKSSPSPSNLQSDERADSLLPRAGSVKASPTPPVSFSDDHSSFSKSSNNAKPNSTPVPVSVVSFADDDEKASHSGARIQPAEEIRKSPVVNSPPKSHQTDWNGDLTEEEFANVKVSSSAASEVNWKITPEDIKEYLPLFRIADEDRDGQLIGKEAVQFFMQSGLSKEILRQVWELSDTNRDGILDQREFVIAMHLIVMYRRLKVALPKTLPPELQNLRLFQ
jgi:hypothetical protein